ncbi:MAG: NAD(P)-dependent alcohol dehydrogenase [Acidimicrobiia bacterium]|nr:NAD(P)-dependent alcohol dehydrogenase [Acidimicrobiia bacterium]
MQAIVQSGYGEPGEVLRLRDVPRPTPGEGEVLVRVRASSVHADVWHVVTGSPLPVRLSAGWSKPKLSIPGTDLAGVVEAVGLGTVGFGLGDDVFGETIARNRQWTNGGTFADYAVARSPRMRLKPAGVSFVEAAAVPTTGTIAVQTLLGGARMQPGDRVLVNGAAGGVGSIAVQVAKAYGAHVTAVDHTDKLAMLSQIGADEMIDYTETDFTETGERYDVILDVASVHPFSAVQGSLAPGGRYEMIGHDHYGAHGRRIGNLGHFFRTTSSAAIAARGQDRPPVIDTRPPLEILADLLDTGDLTPVVDRTYPLSEAPEAIRYLTTGRASGRIVLALA